MGRKLKSVVEETTIPAPTSWGLTSWKLPRRAAVSIVQPVKAATAVMTDRRRLDVSTL